MSRSFSSFTLRRLLPVLAVTVLALPSFSQAGKWKPGKQVRAMAYTMQVTSYDRRGTAKSMTMSLDLMATDKVDAKGKPMWKVKTSHEFLAEERSLQGAHMAFGMYNSALAGYSAAGMQAVMYQQFLGQLELAEGEKMTVFGGMLMKVMGKETIAGIEGFVVNIYRTQNEQEILLAELVLNADIPVALRSRQYNKDKLQSEAVLQNFKFHE